MPKITSQNFNKQIKKICKKLRIDNDVKKTSFQGNKELIEVKEKWELIGTHTARRTFITIASLKSIPDKVGGILAMGASIVVIVILPFLDKATLIKNPKIRII